MPTLKSLLSELADLPPGVYDGELVAFQDGVPHFPLARADQRPLLPGRRQVADAFHERATRTHPLAEAGLALQGIPGGPVERVDEGRRAVPRPPR